eukprot:scaffold97801_cov39-Prasinocladus_malaysianus.AAC.1
MLLHHLTWPCVSLVVILHVRLSTPSLQYILTAIAYYATFLPVSNLMTLFYDITIAFIDAIAVGITSILFKGMIAVSIS